MCEFTSAFYSEETGVITVSHEQLAVSLVPLRDNLSNGPLNPNSFLAVTEFNLHDLKMIPLRYHLLLNRIFFLLLQFFSVTAICMLVH